METDCESEAGCSGHMTWTCDCRLRRIGAAGAVAAAHGSPLRAGCSGTQKWCGLSIYNDSSLHRAPAPWLHPCPLCSELVKLPAGEATPIIKPLPSFPLRLGDAPISVEALPHKLLLLDVQQLSGIEGSGSSGAEEPESGGGGARGEGTRQQLYCSVHLEPAAGGAVSPVSSSSAGRGFGVQSLSAGSPGGWRAEGGHAAPVRTRALPPGAAGVVAWDERLCVALPMQPGALGVGAGAAA